MVSKLFDAGHINGAHAMDRNDNHGAASRRRVRLRAHRMQTSAA
ncbi:hypothetical protein AKJ09_09481 [Labilithrix luteola]|uniref:Uncharacterized protein n=1 Tax=Labilithrix luteola TaxID=1391654 RepID=A0A0K1QAQ8_9BACT|nr:hypothetical protein AKJ09_09481 [Labilithrix luteola]